MEAEIMSEQSSLLSCSVTEGLRIANGNEVFLAACFLAAITCSAKCPSSEASDLAQQPACSFLIVRLLPLHA